MVCFPHQEFFPLLSSLSIVISLVWWQSLYYTPIYFTIKICGERLQNVVVVSVFLPFCDFFYIRLQFKLPDRSAASMFKVVCVRLNFFPLPNNLSTSASCGEIFWSLAEKHCSFSSSTSSSPFPSFSFFTSVSSVFFLQGLR